MPLHSWECINWCNLATNDCCQRLFPRNIPLNVFLLTILFTFHLRNFFFYLFKFVFLLYVNGNTVAWVQSAGSVYGFGGDEGRAGEYISDILKPVFMTR